MASSPLLSNHALAAARPASGAPPAASGKARPGRPKKLSGEGRTAQLHVLVTPAERTAIHRAAADAGLSVSAFVRRRSLGRPVTARADAQARATLRRVGVNLNQLVRAANASPAGTVLATKAEAVLAEVLAAVERLGAVPVASTPGMDMATEVE